MRLILLLIAVALTPRLASAVATTEPISCDAALTRSIDDPSEADHFTFSVTDGERVGIEVANGAPVGSNFNAVWRLLTGTGAPAVSCGKIGKAAGRERGEISAVGGSLKKKEGRDGGTDDTGTHVAYLQR